MPGERGLDILVGSQPLGWSSGERCGDRSLSGPIEESSHAKPSLNIFAGVCCSGSFRRRSSSRGDLVAWSDRYRSVRAAEEKWEGRFRGAAELNATKGGTWWPAIMAGCRNRGFRKAERQQPVHATRERIDNRNRVGVHRLRAERGRKRCGVDEATPRRPGTRCEREIRSHYSTSTRRVGNRQTGSLPKRGRPWSSLVPEEGVWWRAKGGLCSLARTIRTKIGLVSRVSIVIDGKFRAEIAGDRSLERLRRLPTDPDSLGRGRLS